jgi:outer membrane lipoprotein-sorting protein
MKKNWRLIELLLLLGAGYLFAFSSRGYAQTGQELLNKMLESAKKIQTLSYTQVKWERIDGKGLEEKMDVKLCRKPFQVYLKKHYPDAGAEVLYNGSHNGKALVSPGSLIPTLKLDPYGSLMRKNQHHTIFASGFDQLADIFAHLVKKYEAQGAKFLTVQGTETWNGRKFYKVLLNNPEFRYQTYSVLPNENLITIAKKLKLSEYMLLELNKGKVSDYYSVKEGMQLIVPVDYAQKAIILIDQLTYLPLSISIYDDKGLYEKYEYYNFQLNPTFNAETFSEKNKNYKF